MSEKMLVTQALDERDLLVKKISDKIDKASFVDTIKPNEDKVYSKRIGKDEYAKEAESAYQQIVDLIERFQKIDAAIVASNAETEITTSYGKFTVAGAISLRSRLRGLGTYDGEADFEGILKSKMQDEYNERVRTCDLKNSQLQNTAESMRLSILGKDSKTKDEINLSEQLKADFERQKMIKELEGLIFLNPSGYNPNNPKIICFMRSLQGGLFVLQKEEKNEKV